MFDWRLQATESRVFTSCPFAFVNMSSVSPIITFFFSLRLLFCRSLPCAAMLMYDYPFKTDMESVRKMHISCTNMFFKCNTCTNAPPTPPPHPHIHTLPSRPPATCLDRLVPTFLLFLDKQAAAQWTFAYNDYTRCQAAS